MSLSKRAAVIGAVILLASLAFIVGVAVRPALGRWMNGPSSNHPTHQARLDQFKILTQPIDIVVLGDSLVEQGGWSELLAAERAAGVANRGIGQNTTTDVLNRLDAVPRSRVVALMIGRNDIEAGTPPGTIAANTREIVRRLRAPVLLHSVLPKVGENSAAAGEVNALNRKLCATGACTYVDLFPALAPHGDLDPALTRDGTHLNGEGYRRWVGVLEPMLGRTATR